MLWTACCTCFHGFLRSGEATVPTRGSCDPSLHLSMSDLSVDSSTNPQMVILWVKASKIDPFRRGVNVCLGRSDNDMCPVAALLSYVARRGIAPGPLFRFEDQFPLTRDA